MNVTIDIKDSFLLFDFQVKEGFTKEFGPFSLINVKGKGKCCAMYIPNCSLFHGECKEYYA